jgi:hypothetical protein
MSAHVKCRTYISKKTNHVGGLGEDGRIILKWILKKQGARLWIGFNWLRTRTGGGLL